MATTNLASIVVGIAVVALLIVRQMRARPVSADLRIPLILGIIGLIELTGYFQQGQRTPLPGRQADRQAEPLT